MSRKQSLADRLHRFEQGCCPIHGLFMSQIDGWYYPEDWEPYTVVGCPRRDCEAQAKAHSRNGPWELMSACSYLLDETLPPSALATVSRPRQETHTPKAKRSDIWARTDGRCYYCGARLDSETSYTIDHIVPQSRGGLHSLENVVPACKSCNSAKGTKFLEEFRFYRAMQRFQERAGVAFTPPQVEYLRSIGVDLDIPVHTFWFERQ